MTTKEFWEKYINEDILEIFDITCDFFSKKLPEDFTENYDVVEVILETRGHQETAKNFDNVIQFTEILQNKQPRLYEDNFQYFNDFLVDYSCFKQDKQNIHEAFTLFRAKPLQDYDKYLIAFKKILFYQHSDLIEQAISNNFRAVKKSKLLMGNAAYPLASTKLYLVLQEIYERNDQSLDRGEFSSRLSGYNFKLEDDFLSDLEKGILKPRLDADQLNYLFEDEHHSATMILLGYFLQEMHKKGFPFYLSGWIWNNMLEFFEESNSAAYTFEAYFKVKTNLLEKYLAGFTSDMFLDNQSEMIATLWGSVYIFEFLYQNSFIPEEHFLDFLKTSRILKGKVISNFTPDLWNSNFIHGWEKPDCISETEFIEENKIFQKSLSFKQQRFSRLRKELSEELSQIGELSYYIIEGGKDDPTKNKETLWDSLLESTESSQQRTLEPIQTEKKVSRNDPCPCGSGKKYKKCCGQ